MSKILRIFFKRLSNDPSLLCDIRFSDGKVFNGEVNRRNCRYWGYINPHPFSESNTQILQKLNIYCLGILDDWKANLSANFQLLEDLINPLNTLSLEDLVNLQENKIFSTRWCNSRFRW